MCPSRVLGAVSFVGFVGLLGAVTTGCSTQHDQLVRSQTAFEQNDHERAIALLRNLETDLYRLPVPERATYAYLRGMTDYRVGYRADARHWLALAKAYDDASPGLLPDDWRTRTAEALEDMNGVVFADGASALGNSRGR